MFSFKSFFPDAITLFNKGFHVQTLWSTKTNLPSTLSDTLKAIVHNHQFYPNITTILQVLLTTPVTSATVERANSALRFVKSAFRSTMSEERFNALVLLYVHSDIELDYDVIVNKYANKYPRRMLLVNPLSIWKI